MCLLFMYLNDERTPGKYRLIIADNRDEVWSRPTKPLSWSEDGVFLSGQDLFPGREGGTWLGVSKAGKIGVLLNILGILDTTRQGRGPLVREYISNDISGQQFAEENVKNPENFNAFHLILLDLSSSKSESLCCDFSGKQVSLRSNLAGVFICDNAAPGTTWQKSERNKDRFENIVRRYNNTEHKTELVEELINLLKDKTRYPDDKQLRQQAALANMEEEDLISERSSPFVCSPKLDFGTRTHSIVLVDYDGNCEFIEKTMKTPIDPDNIEWETNSFQFKFSSGEG